MSEHQSAASHAKMVPMYHYVAFPLIVVPMFYFASRVVTAFSVEALMMALFAVGTVIGVFFGRVFPLGVQDRVIRLEERMRMREVLPADLHGRIEEISTDAIIGLRFASSDELEGLVRRVLDGDLKDRKAIKAAVQRWRPDHQRV